MYLIHTIMIRSFLKYSIIMAIIINAFLPTQYPLCNNYLIIQLFQCQCTSRILFRMGVLPLIFQLCCTVTTDLRFMIQYPKFAYLTLHIKTVCVFIFLKSMIISKQQNFFMLLHPSFCPLKCRFL